MVDVPPDFAWAGGAWLVARSLLGGAAGEVNEAIRKWTGHRLGNVERVTENAGRKLGDRVLEPGSVPPRVAMRIFEEGSFSDDDVVVEYLGGVLASSKTGEGRDDRGNTFAALVARLSTYDLRSHYIWYSIFRQVLMHGEVNLFDQSRRQADGAVFVPYRVWQQAMGFTAHEAGQSDHVFSHVLHWLNREELVHFQTAGSVEHVRTSLKKAVPAAGMLLSPTVPGVELFLWAHGRGRLTVPAFLDPAEEFPPFPDIAIPDGAVRLKDLAGDPQAPRPPVPPRSSGPS